MNTNRDPELFIEPERYEFHDAPLYQFDLARRDFLKVLGCGVIVLLLVRSALAQNRRGGGRQRPAEIGAWLHIGGDGTVTVFTGKTEVGQNIRTSLAQAVAEELKVPISAIRLVMADTDLTPWDAGTFGSRTTPDMALQLRRVAAAAREALLDLAAERFQADRNTLAISEGKITKRGGSESLTFADLTKERQLVRSVDERIELVPASEWKIAGTSVSKVDGRDYVTGKHQYASDITRPGMLHGKVLRPPAFESTLVSVNTRAAEAMPGVTVVRDGNFVGVAAPDALTASRALDAIEAEWKTEPQISSAELFNHLRRETGAEPDAAAGESAGGQTLRGRYTVAYIAHAPLEPRAAVAEFVEGKLTVWTGTQRPFGVRAQLAEAFGLPETQVRVIVPDTGSGYGGKHTGEAAIEAARLARAAGRPVKLVWTREEEFTWAYFRPAGVIEVSSAVDAQGRITRWDFHNYNSGGSGVRSPYDIPSQTSEFHNARSPLRQGSYRALASAANHFAREVHMDELAAMLKVDPLEFRLRHLKNDRLRSVFLAGAEAFGWSQRKSSPERGFGMSGGTEKGSFVATFAEVAIDRQSGGVRVVRTVTAFECGAIVNPEHLKSQIEGCIVQGIGGALFEAIDFENGRIRNARFSDYRVPRFSDVPPIEIVLLNRKDLPSAGAGETPIIGIAPAIGNAIFAATGVRLRSLPLVPEGMKL